MASNAMHRTLGVPAPQSEPRPGHAMVANSAGGFVYQLDPFAQLRRFLVLGTEGGTFYASERKLTLDNVACIDACLAADPVRTVEEAKDVSVRALAPKNSQAVFVLAKAAASDDPAARWAAHDALNAVCRTFTHLTEYLSYMKVLQGKVKLGRSGRRAVSKFYLDRTPHSAALQVIKYRQRNGFTHRDVLRLAHPAKADQVMASVFDFAIGRNSDFEETPLMIKGFRAAQAPGTSEAEAVELVEKYSLPWEAIPDHLRTAAVWEALMPVMGVTALVRNLATFARKGLLKPNSVFEKDVVAKLTDPLAVRQSKAHPIMFLDAMLVHQSGGASGKSRGERYQPNQAIVAALDEAFRLAFHNVEPTGLRYYLGVDVSLSMRGNPCAGSELIDAAQGSMAMTLLTLATESQVVVKGFTSDSREWRGESYLTPLRLTKRTALADALSEAARVPYGKTDCSLPMLDAARNEIEVDCFVVYTDNETWSGRVHPSQALELYRQKMGIDARLVVVGMTSTGFSIADPKDPLTMDVVGFSADTPQVISGFARGLF